jgi:CelD/BcsL family acetyltransferase involved in cellulose biosynthesis
MQNLPVVEHPLSTLGLSVHEIRTLDELAALRPEWSRLWLRCPSATPFQSPEWLIPWCKHLLNGQLYCLAIRSNQRLIAFLPAFVAPSPGSQARCLFLLGTGISDYLDLLYDPEWHDQVSGLITPWLTTRLEPGVCCDFQALRPNSTLLTAFQGPRWTCATSQSNVCPFLHLDPGRDLAVVVPSHQLHNWRYYTRRAQARGALTIQCAAQSDLAQSLEVFFHLHEARWSDRGSSGALAAPELRAFHCAAAAGFAALGLLRLYVLRINSAPVAALYGFHQRDRFYFYLSGFDPIYESLSPGVLLIGHALQKALAEGAECFDFLRGRESYKYLWGAQDAPLYRLEATTGAQLGTISTPVDCWLGPRSSPSRSD